MTERFVTLMRFQAAEQAQYHKERLGNAGIDAIIVDERHIERPEPELVPGPGGPILLQVMEQDAKRAGEALEEDADDMMDGGNPSLSG